MPKGKNKPNAFLLFMLEWKKEQEHKGRSFPNGLKDVQIDPDCNEVWKNLSEADKSYYKSLAKNTKYESNAGKKTGTGELLSDIEKKQRKDQEFKDNMMEYITSMVNEAYEMNDLQNLEFYVIHVNFFYNRILENNNVEYYPAEIAIAQFSLEKGITRVYHQIVNEKIKIGFANSAKEHSFATHSIPIQAEFGKSDYVEIFTDICEFLKPSKKNGNFPPLYTLYTQEDAYVPAQSVLSRLAVANNEAEDFFLLYSFEELFAKLHNAVIEHTGLTKIESIVASIEIKKDPYVYKSGLECEFHGDLKVGLVHCSESCVKRWIFVFFSYCCDPLDINMIPGFHMPLQKHTNDFTSAASLNATFSNLSLNDSRKASSCLSMSGVSQDYRHRKSERTYKDEQQRKNIKGKPLEIIDHSVINSIFKKKQEPIERPLRIPFTKSAVTYFESTDTESIDLSESSFPSIGRGSIIKKKLQTTKTVGLGYADRLKS